MLQQDVHVAEVPLKRLPDPDGRCADGVIHETHGFGAGFRHKAGR
jgi:hypothetical protein